MKIRIAFYFLLINNFFSLKKYFLDKKFVADKLWSAKKNLGCKKTCCLNMKNNVVRFGKVKYH